MASPEKRRGGGGRGGEEEKAEKRRASVAFTTELGANIYGGELGAT